MHRPEFDKFADEYRATLAASIGASGEEPEFFAEYKIRDLARLVQGMHVPGTRLKALDFGAGTGTSVDHFAQLLPQADLTCVDVSLRSLELGRERFPGGAHFVAFDGRRLPFGDDSFDCALAACVFHHIPASSHVHLIGELRRVLKPSGILLIFEHNPLNPLTVRTVRACPFDDNAVLIPARSLRSRVSNAGFMAPSVQYRMFFPHFLRLLRPLEALLRWLPLGAQYFVVGRK